MVYFKAKILDNLEISSGINYLILDHKIDFIPGQVVNLKTKSVDIPRMYSIASGTSDKFTGILYDVKNTGVLTPILAKLKIGEEVMVSSPFGEFVPKSSSICIASGTGIAPFVSLIRSGIMPHLLIHGAREFEKFYFQDEIEKILVERYIKCLSYGQATGCFSGRLTTYINEFQYIDLNRMYYLCGSPEMVNETREILLTKGIAFSCIHSEIYF